MSVFATGPASPSAGFGRANRTGGLGAAGAPDTQRSVGDLEQITRDLIKGFEEDLTPHVAPLDFWLAKAKESLDDFNDQINDYLVKKNERNLDGIDYDCIYIYYRAAQVVLDEVVPRIPAYRTAQDRYASLKNELLNNDMYFAEIRRTIERNAVQQPQLQAPQNDAAPAQDPLAARFNSLKRSFSSSVNPPVALAALAAPKPHSAKFSLAAATPRSESRSPTPVPFSDSDAGSSRPTTPTVAVPSFNSFIQSPVAKSGLKTPPVADVPTHFKSAARPENNQNTTAATVRSKSPLFDFQHVIRPVQLNDAISQHPERVLVVDFRSTSDFNYRHIYFANSSNVIHLDPVTIRAGYTTADIESKCMVTNSRHELNLFANRDKFDLIVVYDLDSCDLVKNARLKALFDIFDRSDVKPLRKSPVLLYGGLQGWVDLYGASGVASNLGIIRDDLTLDVRQEAISRPAALTSRDSGFVDIYKNSAPSSSGSLKYNRSETDFFSQQLHTQQQGKTSASAVPLNPQKAVSKPPDTPKLNVNVDLGRPQSAIPSPRRTSSSSSKDASQLMEAQKRQQRLDSFDKNLTIITGIANMGNSCYMNCILQCLVGARGLTRFFLMKEYEKKINLKSRLGSKGMISKAFHSVVNDMYTRSVTQLKHPTYYVTPSKFKATIGALNADFRSYSQQDCSEFLNFLLDSLHEDLNQRGDAPKFPPLSTEEEAQREKMSMRLAATIEWEKYLKTDFSSIVDFFQGQYLSRLQCTVCNATSTTYNAFSTLSVPIPENVSGPITLKMCFEEFCKTEILDADDRWFCPRCQKKQRSTKTLKISIMPKNLIVHLKRFKIGVTSVTKLDSFVKFPTKLSMLEYWPQAPTDAEKAKIATFPDRGQTPPFDYELYGVTNHYGSLRYGHYTAYVDKGEANGVKNGWCYFDDTSVTRNCDIAKVINGNAYVLFYRRV